MLGWEGALSLGWNGFWWRGEGFAVTVIRLVINHTHTRVHTHNNQQTLAAGLEGFASILLVESASTSISLVVEIRREGLGPARMLLATTQQSTDTGTGRGAEVRSEREGWVELSRLRLCGGYEPGHSGYEPN